LILAKSGLCFEVRRRKMATITTSELGELAVETKLARCLWQRLLDAWSLWLKWIDRPLVVQTVQFGSVLLLLRQVFRGALVHDAKDNYS
jgi:hypothetical protein